MAASTPFSKNKQESLKILNNLKTMIEGIISKKDQPFILTNNTLMQIPAGSLKQTAEKIIASQNSLSSKDEKEIQQTLTELKKIETDFNQWILNFGSKKASELKTSLAKNIESMGKKINYDFEKGTHLEQITDPTNRKMALLLTKLYLSLNAKQPEAIASVLTEISSSEDDFYKWLPTAAPVNTASASSNTLDLSKEVEFGSKETLQFASKPQVLDANFDSPAGSNEAANPPDNETTKSKEKNPTKKI